MLNRIVRYTIKHMNKENSSAFPNEYPGKLYAESEVEREIIESQIGLVRSHYDDEISVHEEVSSSVSPGEPNPFADEYGMLVASRDAELTPLTQKHQELMARLRRLYTVAWNEANAKENRDKRYQEHQEALPAVQEMHKEIRHIYTEIDAFNKRAVGIVRDAEETASQLEILLQKEVSSDDDEKQIRNLIESLVEVYGKITSMEHVIVHSATTKTNQ